MLRILLTIFIVTFLIIPHISVQSYAEEKFLTKEEKREAEERKIRRIEQALKNLSSKNYIPFEKAIYKFETLGLEGIPYLKKHLRKNKKDEQLRINIIYTFGRIGPDAKGAVPMIVASLKSKNSDFRAEAAIALGKIGHDSKDAVPFLIPLLNDDSEWVVKNVLEALKRIGSENAHIAIKEFREKSQKK